MGNYFARNVKKNMSNNRRPNWDEIWMSLALHISQRSYDNRNKVGCVIVTTDNTTVLGLGYNGDESGGTNTTESNEPGKSGFIHAEANALLKCNYGDYRDKKMYLTLSPCNVCAKMIINSGIKEVIYLDEYRNNNGIELLDKRSIKIRKFNIWE